MKKKFKFALSLTITLISLNLHAGPFFLEKEYIHSAAKPKISSQPEYKYSSNPHISAEVWELVKPYLLPSNHPIKTQLDAIFRHTRVSQNTRTLRAAGFSRCYIRGYSKLIVTTHPMLRGYWMKLFIDEQDMLDYPYFIHRIQGAQAIKESIERHGYQDHFSVPQKWLYPLPAEPSPPDGCQRKNFILICEDMDLYKKSGNYKKWASKITPPRALAIYTIMQELGLNDCIHPFNLPFSHDGRQSFIDTEHHHNWPVRFDLMVNHFPEAIRNYWLKIIETNGHP